MKMSIDMEEDMDFQQVSVPHPPDIQEQISTAVGIAVAQALADNQPASSPQLVREPSVTFEDAFGSTEVQEKGELISLMAGDLIWLRTDGIISPIKSIFNIFSLRCSFGNVFYCVSLM